MIGPASPEKRYELVERIAVGGMAEVFLAKSYGPHGFEKVLAIKRILPGLAADPKFERRFIAEAKLAVSLTHANIVQVLDFSRFGQSLYIVMEFVDGGDLAHVLDRVRERGQQLPLAAALHVSSELLKGLDFAHRRGVVHRDISPSNILLSRAGEVKIADFGIAQGLGFEMTRSMRIMGKWRYMSPEQAAGEEMDARSDVFSAGVVVYETLTGQRLFPGDTAEEIVRNLRTMPITRPSQLRADLPRELDAPLAAALERDRDRRMTSAAQLLGPMVEASFAMSLPALPTALARFLDEKASPGGDGAAVAPPTRHDSRPGTGAGLLDQIIVSELSDAAPLRTSRGKRGGMSGRLTAMALGPPEVAPEDLPNDGPDEAPPAPMPAAVPASLLATTTPGRPARAVPSAPGPALGGDLGDDEPEETALGATFIRSVEDASGSRRWELAAVGDPALGDAAGDGRDEDDFDDDGDVTRAVEARAPDTPVPRFLPLSGDAQDAAQADTIVAPPPHAPWLPSLDLVSRTGTIVSASPPMARAAPPAPQPAVAAAEATGQRARRPRGRRDSLLPLVSSRRFMGAVAAVVAAGSLFGVVIAHSSGPAATGAGARLPSLATPIGAGATTAPAAAADPARRSPDGQVAAPPSTPSPPPSPSPVPSATASPPPSATGTPPSPTTRPAPPAARAHPADPPDARAHPAHPTSGERRDRTGTVDIYAEPWANIYLGKRKVGVAPQRGVRLPVGRHRLHLVNPVLERSAWVTVTVPASAPVRVFLPDR
ncbi:MAG TPA: serine/threonine-protein kinase [Kofleriaceae bacterium]|nr:serine/threonine-protein kinase [Kofleriaceae bacterium]